VFSTLVILSHLNRKRKSVAKPVLCPFRQISYQVFVSFLVVPVLLCIHFHNWFSSQEDCKAAVSGGLKIPHVFSNLR